MKRFLPHCTLHDGKGLRTPSDESFHRVHDFQIRKILSSHSGSPDDDTDIAHDRLGQRCLFQDT